MDHHTATDQESITMMDEEDLTLRDMDSAAEALDDIDRDRNGSNGHIPLWVTWTEAVDFEEMDKSNPDGDTHSPLWETEAVDDEEMDKSNSGDTTPTPSGQRTPRPLSPVLTAWTSQMIFARAVLKFYRIAVIAKLKKVGALGTPIVNFARVGVSVKEIETEMLEALERLDAIREELAKEPLGRASTVMNQFQALQHLYGTLLGKARTHMHTLNELKTALDPLNLHRGITGIEFTVIELEETVEALDNAAVIAINATSDSLLDEDVEQNQANDVAGGLDNLQLSEAGV